MEKLTDYLWKFIIQQIFIVRLAEVLGTQDRQKPLGGLNPRGPGHRIREVNAQQFKWLKGINRKSHGGARQLGGCDFFF